MNGLGRTFVSLRNTFLGRPAYIKFGLSFIFVSFRIVFLRSSYSINQDETVFFKLIQSVQSTPNEAFFVGSINENLGVVLRVFHLFFLSSGQMG